MHLDRDLGIKPSDLVLDIGPGSLPFERADLLVDRWPGSEGIGQRGGEQFKADGKPVVIADGCELPFADNTFDFVMCSHIVEHIKAERINRFLQEIGRVGRQGYIEAPSEIYEKMWDVKEHHWFVYVNDEDGLILRPKTPRNCCPQYFGAFWPLLSKARGFRDFMDGYKEMFFVGYLWSVHPKWKVVCEYDEVVDWHDERSILAWIGDAGQNYQGYAESCLDPQVLRRRGRRWALKECLLMSVPAWFRNIFKKIKP